MKMFLTRIGFGSKAVVTGDVSQVDLPRTQLSGLVDAERVLRRVKGIAITRLTSADVVRHPLVARIVDAYDKTRSGPAGVDSDVDASDSATDSIAPPARKTSPKSRNGS
jgi:phosphate starvation-inducible PhoH-like protein